MPLESASFINGLDANNPAGGDSLSQADDHLRLIKAAVKATFPNVTGAILPTQTIINDLATKSGSETLTNKTISGSSNTITNIPNSAVSGLGALALLSSVGTPQLTDGSVTLGKLADISTTYATRAYADALVASGKNGFGTRTVSSSAPSGGSNGDIWYQY